MRSPALIFPPLPRRPLFADSARFAVCHSILARQIKTDCASIISCDIIQPVIFMLNPASGGASVGVWGRNTSAVKLMLPQQRSCEKSFFENH